MVIDMYFIQVMNDTRIIKLPVDINKYSILIKYYPAMNN